MKKWNLNYRKPPLVLDPEKTMVQYLEDYYGELPSRLKDLLERYQKGLVDGTIKLKK